MSISKFKALLDSARNSDAYAVTSAKTKFSRQIKQLLIRNGTSRKELAHKLKCTQANISKLINSEGNLRLESMVKLARAAGGEFVFEVRDKKLYETWERSWSKYISERVEIEFLAQMKSLETNRAPAKEMARSFRPQLKLYNFEDMDKCNAA